MGLERTVEVNVEMLNFNVDLSHLEMKMNLV